MVNLKLFRYVHMFNEAIIACARDHTIGVSFELGSAQTRSWRTASSGFAELWFVLWSPAKSLETVLNGFAGLWKACRVFKTVFSLLGST